MQPRIGTLCTVEIAAGVVVRDEHSARKLTTGDRLVWSSYLQRRRLEGAVRVIEDTSPEAPGPETRSEGGRK
jgi:hypothetical protein